MIKARVLLAFWVVFQLSGLVFAQKERPESSADPAVVLLEQARDLRRQGDLEEARTVYQRLILLVRNQSRKPLLAEALHDASLLDISLGNYSEAIPQAAEAARTQAALRDKRGQARGFNTMGLAFLYLGNYAAAMNHYQRALALDREGQDFEGEVVRLRNIGNVRYFQGAYSDTLQFYQEGLDLIEQQQDEAWAERERSIALINLATLYQKVGLYSRALDLYQSLPRTGGGLSPREEALQLSNLGVLYRHMGDPVKALEAYRQAQQLFLKERDLDAEIGVLKNIGIALALDFGDYPGALGSFREVLEKATKTSNRREAMQAHLYSAESLRRAGDLVGAREEFSQSLRFGEQLGATEEVWKSLYGLGRIAEATGQEEIAVDHFQRAVTVIESVRSRLRLSSLKPGFLADKREAYDALISALLGGRAQLRDDRMLVRLDLDRALAQRLFELLEAARGRFFQDQLASFLSNLRNQRDSALVDRLSEIRAKIGRVWSQQLKAGDPEQTSDLLSRLTDLENQYVAVEQQVSELTQSSPTRLANADEIRGGLQPSSQLLSYWVGDGELAVFVIRENGLEVWWRALEAGFQSRVRACVEALSRPEDEGWQGNCERVGELLPYDLSERAGSETLLIVPDKQLTSLPFEVLRPPGSSALLVESFNLFYLPSAGFAIRRAADFPRGRIFPWRSTLVVYGDPSMSLDSAAGVEGEESLQPLQHSRAEAHAASDQLPGRSQLFLGKAATKQNFLHSIGEATPVLHLATHAVVDPSRPERSRLLFSPEEKGSSSLFLGEILSLSFDDTELVVLSACETAGGKFLTGEGLQDFSRAFLMRGAKTTVATLWRVEDLASSELMRFFYSGLAAGHSRAEALRRAKTRFLRAEGAAAHPYYWAGFVLYGEGTTPLPLPFSWRNYWTLCLLVAAGAGLILAGVRYVRRHS